MGARLLVKVGTRRQERREGRRRAWRRGSGMRRVSSEHRVVSYMSELGCEWYMNDVDGARSVKVIWERKTRKAVTG